MFLTSNIRIDGPELGEVVAAQLEGTIYEPGLGFAEELKLLLFFRWQRQDGVFCLQLHLLERSHQECVPLPTTGSLGLVFCVSRFAAGANNLSFKMLGYGPSSL